MKCSHDDDEDEEGSDDGGERNHLDRWTDSIPKELAKATPMILMCVISMILGFVIGVTVETSAWWNPVSAWRALRNAETNPLLLVFAPESNEHARIAAGS